MTPAQHALLEGLQAPLLTHADGERFLASESAILEALRTSEASLTVVEHANLKARMNVQFMQSAWLRIEEAFAVDPDLGSMLIARDEEDGKNGYLYVQMGQNDDTEVFGPCEYPGGADEKLQEFLNDMGRNQFSEFHNDLVSLELIERDNLEACAIAVMGDRWNSARRSLMLDQDLPAPQPSSNKPRF